DRSPGYQLPPAPSGRVRGGAVGSTDVEGDGFYLHVLLDPLASPFAAQAALFESAEGDLVRVAGRIVHADEAVLQRLARPDDAAQVARGQVGGQPKGGVVGPRDDFVIGVEGEHRRDGTEGLVAG